jgi:hypothetical protein
VRLHTLRHTSCCTMTHSKFVATSYTVTVSQISATSYTVTVSQISMLGTTSSMTHSTMCNQYAALLKLKLRGCLNVENSSSSASLAYNSAVTAPSTDVALSYTCISAHCTERLLLRASMRYNRLLITSVLHCTFCF